VLIVELFDPKAEQDVDDEKAEAASLDDAISVGEGIGVCLVAFDSSL
jgi:hypothetical protein